MDDPSKRAKKGGDKHGTPCSSSSYSSSIRDLPSHILIEILLRLPIKTLVASKSVRKSWLHLINDPYFAKLHQSRSNVEICFQRPCENNGSITKLQLGNLYFPNDSHSRGLELNTYLELPTFRGNLSFVSSCNDSHSIGLNLNSVLELPTTIRGINLSFVNSCNGLLCYSGESNRFALIWNPITSQFFTVLAPKEPEGWSITSYRSYGLGFSQKTNRFKLLCIYGKKKVSFREVMVAEICTIDKGRSWKTIDPSPYAFWEAFGNYKYGAFLRGALHWFGGKSGIVSFDFDDEKFARIPLPSHFKTVKIKYSDNHPIGVLEGCLFLSETTKRRYNIWVMKKFGDQDSWTRVICLKFTPDRRYKCMWCMPLSSNGKILMMHVISYFCMYNPCEENSTTDRVITFNPSLVLLPNDLL